MTITRITKASEDDHAKNVPGVGSTLVASEVDEGELSKQRLPSLVLAEDDLHNLNFKFEFKRG